MNRPVLAPGHQLDRIQEAQRSAAASGDQHRRSDKAAARSQIRGRVLVVDDSETLQQVAASVVSETQRLRLIGAAASGEEAIRLVPELKPDLVLLDVHMPGLSGLETAPSS